MNIQLELKDKQDLLLLMGCIDTVQDIALNRDINMGSNINNVHTKKMYESWNKETVEEWYRLQKIKCQINKINNGEMK